MTAPLKYCIIVLFVFFWQSNYSQSIGFRGGFELTDQKQTNRAYGGGVYLNIDSISEKMQLLFSFDYSGKSQKYVNKDLQTRFAKYHFSTSALFVNPLSENIDFKFGPSISYNVYQASHQGIFLRWIDNYNSKFIGTGLVSNLQIKTINNSPFNVDFFIMPYYFFNIDNNILNRTDISGTKAEYGNNSFSLTFKIGVSYTIIPND